MPREELVPMVHIDVDDGVRLRAVRGADLVRIEGGNTWRTRFDLVRLDTVQMRVRAALIDDAATVDTLAVVQTRLSVLPHRGYVIMVVAGPNRPYGFTVDEVVAAPFRPFRAPRPNDSLFVSWGYYVKGPGPIP